MKNEHLPNNKMLCFLTKISSGFNPFLFQNSKASNNYIYPKADSIIYKEEKLVRCPICLGESLYPARPNSCRHIFCLYCIDKWMKQVSKCPMCKRKISCLIKVDLNEALVVDQMDIFA